MNCVEAALCVVSDDAGAASELGMPAPAGHDMWQMNRFAFQPDVLTCGNMAVIWNDLL